MMLLRRLVIVLWSVLLLAAPASALQPSAGGQTEFVPIDQLPPGEQLPAAPLLIAAYVFVWLAAIFYIWSIWRRLNKVEAEMRALGQRRP